MSNIFGDVVMQHEPKNLLQPKPPPGLRKNLKPIFESQTRFLSKKRPLEETFVRENIQLTNTPDFGSLSVLQKSERVSKEKLNISTAAVSELSSSQAQPSQKLISQTFNTQKVAYIDNNQFFRNLDLIKQQGQNIEKNHLLWDSHMKVLPYESYSEFNYNLGLVEQSESHNSEPSQKGGFLDHIQAEWRSQKNILIIMKNGREICPRQMFQYEVNYVQVYQGNVMLVYTTDFIYQMQVKQNDKTIEVIRDDSQKIVTNQIDFTISKQHHSGLIVAGGSQGESIQIHLGQKTQKMINFSKRLKDTSVQKTIGERIYDIFTIFNFHQNQEQVKSIAFTENSPKDSTFCAILVVNSQKINLSKINIYQLIQPKPGLILDAKPYLKLHSTIYFRSIFRQTASLIDYRLISSKILPNDFEPINLDFNLGTLQIYLKNGLKLSFDEKVIKIGLSPFERAMAISNRVQDEIFNRNFLENMEANDEYNPLFQTERMKFRGDEEMLKSFVSENVVRGKKAKMIRTDEKNQISVFEEQVMVVQKEYRLCGISRLPMGFEPLDVQMTNNGFKIMATNGEVITFKYQTKFDLTCQMMAIKQYFEQDNTSFISNNQVGDLAMLKNFTNDFMRHIDLKYEELVHQLQDRDESIMQTVKSSSFYRFLTDLMKISLGYPKTFMNQQKIFEYYKGLQSRRFKTFIDCLAANPSPTMSEIQISDSLSKTTQKTLELLFDQYLGPGTLFDSQFGDFKNQENEHILDLRSDQLKLDKYSILGQIKIQLILDYISEVIQTNDQNSQIFLFTNKMKVNQRFSANSLQKAGKQLEKLRELIQSGFLPETQNVKQDYQHEKQLCPLFRQMTHLIDVLIEGLEFLESSFFQRQEERMTMFNDKLFFIPTKSFDDLLIGKAPVSLHPREYASLTLKDFLIDGPHRNSKILKILETFLTYDPYFNEQALLTSHPTYLPRTMLEVILGKRYLEEAKSLLYAKSNDFILNQSRRHQVQVKALEYLMKNCYNSDTKASCKLLIENYMYLQAVVFCIQKAQQCIQVQRYIMQKKGPEVDQKIENNEQEKLQSFSFVVEMLEEIIDRLRSIQKIEKVEQIYKATEKWVQNTSKNPLSIWDRLFDKLHCTKKGQKMIKTQPTKIIDLVPSENILKSRFEAINILRNQLTQKSSNELLEIKNEIYNIVGSQDLGIELLHRKIFVLLMEKGLTDDMFKLKSPFLQDFIEKDMQGEKIAVLQATTKHFLKLGQPISLFNYLVENLIENNQHPDLDIDDRLNFIQNSIAQLEDLHFSEEFLVKKKWVDEIVNFMIIQRQLRNKLRRKNYNLAQIDEQLSYQVITNGFDLLQFSIDTNQWSVQLRLISLLSNSNDDLRDYSLAAWRGLISKSFTSKLTPDLPKDLFSKFEQKCVRLLRLSEIPNEIIVNEMVEQIQKYVENQRLNIVVEITQEETPLQFLGVQIKINDN